MIILGIHGSVSTTQHDPGAALIQDGKLIAFVEEERLTRVKSPRGTLPIESIAAVLQEAKITMPDVDLVVHAGETYEDASTRIKSYLIHFFGYAPKLRLINHQLAHMASAFYMSGYESSMVLSYDGYGDRLSASLGKGTKDGGIKIIKTYDHENSLGLFYETITSFLGFIRGDDEYKVMGLAPYGEPKYDLSFFATPTPDGYVVDCKNNVKNDPAPTCKFEPGYSTKVIEHLGMPRLKGEGITQRHRDIAASVQYTMETCAVSLVKYLHRQTGERNLCLAGGCALNCSTNNILGQMDCVDALFIQPAASDRGLALGCALQAAFEEGEKIESIQHVYYGPSRDIAEIETALKLTGIGIETLDDPAGSAAKLLAQGCVIGWYQGRSEFGPRALGNRSILADPGRANMKDQINARVKYREEFRPFIPSVLVDRASEIFNIKSPSPFMTVACDVNASWTERLIATTHINNTARVQTVSPEDNASYHALITAFNDLNGSPVVLNTSFNINGQPIVESPLDAISTFAGTGLDAVILGPYIVRKPETPRVG